MDARVVEEVVVVNLLRPGGSVLDNPGRDRLPRQPVVDRRRDPDQLSRHHVEHGLEWRVAALVRHHLALIDPDGGAVGRGVEPQHDPGAIPAAGYAHDPLVPDLADVVARGITGDDVVIACGHGHRPGARQFCQPPLLLPAHPLDVEGEVPYAVQ